MRIYITGATGFVGAYVVEQALRQGHDVTAVIRPGRNPAKQPNNTAKQPNNTAKQPNNTGTVDTDDGGGTRGSVREVRVDLRSRHGLTESLEGADVVVHLAAAKAGDFYTQFAGTVVATENLLAAMDEAGVTGLVGISTFSVYDYLHIKPGTLIDEHAPIDTTPNLRDEYARTKLLQEKLYRRFGEDEGTRLAILRPGMIYGPDHLWHALLGADVGTRFLRIGTKAVLPMSYVENCAEAIVLAAERLVDGASSIGAGDLNGAVINIVDDDLPTQQVYAELVSSRMETPPSVRVPWVAVRAAAGLLKKGNQLVLAGRAKFPGIAVPDRLHARFKPLRYTNHRAKQLLGWTPRYDLVTAIDRSIAVEQGSADRDTEPAVDAGAIG